jgi:hypothetical protein
MSVVDLLAAPDAPREPLRDADAANGSGRLLAGFVTGLAVVVPFAVLAWPLLSRQVCTYDDLGDFHLPIRAFYAECLANGDSFLWCPRLFGGFYLHGESQAGMAHPLHLLLYSVFPLDIAFNLELLVNYPILLLGTFLLLRRNGFAREAALFGAVVFTFSGFNLLHYPHVNALAIIAHLPWQLLALGVAFHDPNPRRVALARAAVSLLTASQVLLGYPQYVWLCSLLEIFYGLFLLRPWPGLARLVGYALAKAIGVLLGAIQLVPTWDCLTHSFRQAPAYDFLAKGSLPPVDLILLVAPYLYKSRIVSSMPDFHCNTHEHSLYCGALVTLLAIWAVVYLRHQGPHQRITRAGLVLGIVALLLALGSNTPLFHLSSRLPFLNLFRYSSRYNLLFHAALAVLAAVSYADLARPSLSRIGRRPPWFWVLAVGPLASAFIAAGTLAVAYALPDSYVAKGCAGFWAASLGIVLTVAAACLIRAAARGQKWALPAMLLFTTADQTGYGISYIFNQGIQNIDSFIASRSAPQAAPDRLLMDGNNDAPMMQQQVLCNGYVGLFPRQQLDFDKASSRRVAGAAFEQLEEGWLPLPSPLPRARLVTQAVASEKPSEDLDQIDPETTALVGPATSIDLDASSSPGKAHIRVDRPGNIRVAVDVPTRQLLVLTESYHEGWQASVSDKPSPVLPVYGDLLGCVIEAGHHEVEFRFRPRSFTVGAWISGAGGVLLLLSLGLGLRRAG